MFTGSIAVNRRASAVTVGYRLGGMRLAHYLADRRLRIEKPWPTSNTRHAIAGFLNLCGGQGP